MRILHLPNAKSLYETTLSSCKNPALLLFTLQSLLYVFGMQLDYSDALIGELFLLA